MLSQLSSSGSALTTKLSNAGNFGFPSDGGGVGSGLATLDLRHLGSKRVLILVDGVRWANESSGSGASDPLSGTVAMLAEARALGQLVRQGWQSKRTLVYNSWDGEEAGLLGSTEWVEANADELRLKAVAYINTDSNGRG